MTKDIDYRRANRTAVRSVPFWMVPFSLEPSGPIAQTMDGRTLKNQRRVFPDETIAN
jgi:hypothetical protein